MSGFVLYVLIMNTNLILFFSEKSKIVKKSLNTINFNLEKKTLYVNYEYYVFRYLVCTITNCIDLDLKSELQVSYSLINFYRFELNWPLYCISIATNWNYKFIKK